MRRGAYNFFDAPEVSSLRLLWVILNLFKQTDGQVPCLPMWNVRLLSEYSCGGSSHGGGEGELEAGFRAIVHVIMAAVWCGEGRLGDLGGQKEGWK